MGWLTLAAVAVLGTTGFLGWSSIQSDAKSRPVVPYPNGYDDLIRAGQLISGDWHTPKGDLELVRSFVAANGPAFDSLRLGLSRDCVASFDDSDAGYATLANDLNRFHNLSRLVMAEAQIAEADGRITDASRSCRDVLALGRAIMQGSMSAGAMYGWVIQHNGMDQLRRLRAKLSAEDCRAIIRDLEAIDRRPIPLKDVADRRETWYVGANSPFSRAASRMSGLERKGRAEELAIAKKHFDLVDRSRRFLLVELAIHAHHRDLGTWPRSIEELVPNYLASVPIDPSSGKPLNYPKEPTGELIHGFAAIAEPKGSVASTAP